MIRPHQRLLTSSPLCFLAFGFGIGVVVLTRFLAEEPHRRVYDSIVWLHGAAGFGVLGPVLLFWRWWRTPGVRPSTGEVLWTVVGLSWLVHMVGWALPGPPSPWNISQGVPIFAGISAGLIAAIRLLLLALELLDSDRAAPRHSWSDWFGMGLCLYHLATIIVAIPMTPGP